MNLKVPGAIGDVANWKRHQRLDEILIVFTRTTSEKSAKLFSKKKKKFLSYNTPAKFNAIPFAQHTLAVMRAFHLCF